MKNNQAAVIKELRRYSSFLVTTHQNPDADAIGSALAMALFLESLGKKVDVYNEDMVPQWLSFLPATRQVKKPSQAKKHYEAAVVLDCGDLARVGKVAALIGSETKIINIDHHVTNDFFGSTNYVITSSSSSCEIVYDILQKAKFKMTKSVAMLLYAGIMTDTGSFRFDNTTSTTHEVVADLMRFGFDPQAMYDRLYVGIPVEDMKLFTDVIHGAELILGKKVFCVQMTAAVAQGFSKKFDLKEKLFSFMRSVEGIEVVVILTQLSSKEVRLNMRSQGHVDVARLAQQFNGGGHKRAAGGKIAASLADARKLVLAALEKKIDKT